MRENKNVANKASIQDLGNNEQRSANTLANEKQSEKRIQPEPSGPVKRQASSV